MLLSFQILVDIAQVVLPFLLKKWVYVYFEFDPKIGLILISEPHLMQIYFLRQCTVL